MSKIKERIKEQISVSKNADGVYQLRWINVRSRPHDLSLDEFKFCIELLLSVLKKSDCTSLQLILEGKFRDADYEELIYTAGKEGFLTKLEHIDEMIIELSEIDKPTVVLFDKACTGLAAAFLLLFDRRIGIGPKAKMGFPEGAFGMLTGNGSFSKLLGLVDAELVFDLLNSGRMIKPEEAEKAGLLQDRISSWEQVQAWLQENSTLHTEDKFKWKVDPDQLSATIQQLNAKSIKPLLMTEVLLSLIQNSEGQSFKDLLTKEHLAYLGLLTAKETMARVRTFHYAVEDAIAMCKEVEEKEINKVAVIGAGMMGSGIAYEVAKAGIDVILKDVDLQNAERGRAYSEKLCNKLIELNKMKEDDKPKILERILPTDQLEDLDGAEIIVEAVFEDKRLKAEVINESKRFLAQSGLFASNTTSLPISKLSKSFDDPSRFIGLHFFSPVDRMALVEVIRGKETSEETLDKALSFVGKLKKIPIVVNDGPAFFTSRIFFYYLLEGITMLLEGVPAERIEEAAKNSGFGVGPLAVLDEISLPLMVHVYEQLPDMSFSQKRVYNYLQRMIKKGRTGRKSSRGFYDYPDNKPKKYYTDPELKDLDSQISAKDIQDRLLAVLALDSYRCLEEGILFSPIDGDLGSVMGLGYPVQTGGVFGYIDMIGLDEFIKICENFGQYGDEWEIPDSLIKLRDEGFQFYDGFESNWVDE
ncbi:3-hydroxyacyl-CoA dehydrogenase NAD-binding domain-containing protein [Sphingobacterium sp.]|uniref:3-hydroxyacyl-CoA dehydrogenase NAD-binding domain-containing protein n=1 Tax=Sphingobacterium sp. TaxID=341027 RepID=UPI0028A892C0|nr:3-hydroxyacyl-CoA dehydrogenase NAD-binding domain-containing protein [Sphingobacterium sp.]